MINNLLKSVVCSCLATLVLFVIFFLLSNIIIIQQDKVFLLLGIVFIVNLISVFLYLAYIHRYFPSMRFKKEQDIQTLKTTEKYRREFFGNVSHELKTPIFNIQGYVETLIDGAIYDKKVNKKYLRRTLKSVDRLIYIIQDLESISQLESAELKLDISEWKLKDLINELVDQFEIKASRKHIKLIHNRRSTNVRVLGDKDKISQVLSNLISNSIKYGKKNGFTKISFYIKEQQGFVSIKDNGIGIAQKNIVRLFERFYRVDKSRSRDQGGTGLGLSIVKHILEAHNEQINVKSTLGKGTEFIFSIKSK